MNARQANSISINEYLNAKGIKPARSNPYYSMYRAPYRYERAASLKVSHKENLWVDYGEGIGGTLIDLVLKINQNFNVSEAIKEIHQTTSTFFSFHQQKACFQLKIECRKIIQERRKSKVDSRQSRIETRQLSLETRNAKNTLPVSKHQMPATNFEIPNTKHVFGNSKHETAKTKYVLRKTCRVLTDTDIGDLYYSKKANNAIIITMIQELGNNKVIVDYLNSRGIQVETAKLYCKEIYYQINKRRYFGLANKNHKGWSIRNKY